MEILAIIGLLGLLAFLNWSMVKVASDFDRETEKYFEKEKHEK